MPMKKTFSVLTSAFAGSLAGGALVKKVWLDKYHEQTAALAAAERERDLTYTWLLLEMRGIRLKEYMDAHGLKTVAVFGMSRIGRRAAEELGDAAVYAVELDHFNAVHERLTVYRLGDDPLPEADCMLLCDLERVPEKLAAARREFPGTVVTLAEVLRWLLGQHKIEPRDGAVAAWPPADLVDSKG